MVVEAPQLLDRDEDVLSGQEVKVGRPRDAHLDARAAREEA